MLPAHPLARHFAHTGAAFACALLLNLSAAAQDRQVGTLSDILPHTSKYLALPAQERDRFEMVYTVSAKEPGTRFSLWLMDGGMRTPVTLSADGQLDFKTLAPLLARDPALWTDLPKGGAALNMTMRPVLPLATDVPTEDIARAIRQTNKAIERAAGMAALLAPKMKAVEFTLPASATGVLILADGKEKPLKSGKGATLRVPASELKKAVRVRFSDTPTAARFSTE